MQKEILLIINFTSTSPTNSQECSANFFLHTYIHSISANVFDRFKFLSWQSENKTKQKENENLFNLLFIPRCRGPPHALTLTFHLVTSSVCSIDSRATPATPPPPFPTPPHSPSHSNNNKKILCQFPWADDGGHQSPQYTTVYIVYI